jgi:PPOX class probable F420-dependent enzyme
MSTKMSRDEALAFLVAAPRTAKLATTRADGRPHVAPVWIDLDDDGTILFMTGAETLKGRSLRRDPRASLCVDDDAPPYAFAIVDLEVSLSEDLGELLHWGTRIAARYLGPEVADAVGRRNAVPGELLVRARPTHVTGERGVTD